MFEISVHFILAKYWPYLLVNRPNHRRGPWTCKKERDQYSPIRTKQASSIKYLLQWLFLICCMINLCDSATYSQKTCAPKVSIYFRFSRRFCGHLPKIALKHEGKNIPFLETSVYFAEWTEKAIRRNSSRTVHLQASDREGNQSELSFSPRRPVQPSNRRRALKHVETKGSVACQTVVYTCKLLQWKNFQEFIYSSKRKSFPSIFL